MRNCVGLNVTSVAFIEPGGFQRNCLHQFLHPLAGVAGWSMQSLFEFFEALPASIAEWVAGVCSPGILW